MRGWDGPSAAGPREDDHVPGLDVVEDLLAGEIDASLGGAVQGVVVPVCRAAVDIEPGPVASGDHCELSFARTDIRQAVEDLDHRTDEPALHHMAGRVGSNAPVPRPTLVTRVRVVQIVVDVLVAGAQEIDQVVDHRRVIQKTREAGVHIDDPGDGAVDEAILMLAVQPSHIGPLRRFDPPQVFADLSGCQDAPKMDEALHVELEPSLVGKRHR